MKRRAKRRKTVDILAGNERLISIYVTFLFRSVVCVGPHPAAVNLALATYAGYGASGARLFILILGCVRDVKKVKLCQLPSIQLAWILIKEPIIVDSRLSQAHAGFPVHDNVHHSALAIFALLCSDLGYNFIYFRV